MAKPEKSLGACDGCRSTTDPREVATVYGQVVIRCLDYRACLARAKAAGIYKVIPGVRR